MTESERLQKIVVAQEKELKRLRWLLGHARVACAEIDVDATDEKRHLIRVTLSAIGCDEYHFMRIIYMSTSGRLSEDLRSK